MAQLTKDEQYENIELKQTETSHETQDRDEIDEFGAETGDKVNASKSLHTYSEKVSWSAKLLTSTWNPVLTSIAKHAVDWLCWNTNKNIFWNFEVKDASTKMIAFSVDDAPGKGLKGMNEVLDIMKEYQVHCTFFIISSHIRDPKTKRIDKKAAAVIDRMLSEGHELGNHGSEDEKLFNLSEEQYVSAIKESEDVIAEFDNGFKEKKVKWYRPPHGIMTKTHYKVVTNMGSA